LASKRPSNSIQQAYSTRSALKTFKETKNDLTTWCINM